MVGSGLTGLWSSLLFISGNSIRSNAGRAPWNRWSACLHPFAVIVFGKNLANVVQSLISMIVAYLLASLLFGYSLHRGPAAAVLPLYLLTMAPSSASA